MQTLNYNDSGDVAALTAEPVLPLEAGVARDVWFGYRIGCHHFVLDKALQSELVIKPVIYALPKSPGWLCGVINLRGNILSVVDLSASLSTTCKSAAGEYVLVIDKGNDALALLVDGPPRSLPDPILINASSEGFSLQSDFIQAGVESENHKWMQLDIKGMVRHLQTAV